MRVNFYDSVFVRIILVKAQWLAWRVALPLMFLPQLPPAHFALLFAVAELSSGVWLAWNFEVSHLAPEALFPVVKEGAAKGQLEMSQSWAVAQVEGSVDYAHDSALTTWWCGALNYQIEHHLFPGISQYHYPALAPIVKKCCEEFGVRYNYHPTFVSAWSAHVRMLYEMGKKGFSYKWD